MIIFVWFEDHAAATDSSPFGPLLVRGTLRNAANGHETLRDRNFDSTMAIH